MRRGWRVAPNRSAGYQFLERVCRPWLCWGDAFSRPRELAIRRAAPECSEWVAFQERCWWSSNSVTNSGLTRGGCQPPFAWRNTTATSGLRELTIRHAVPERNYDTFWLCARSVTVHYKEEGFCRVTDSQRLLLYGETLLLRLHRED